LAALDRFFAERRGADLFSGDILAALVSLEKRK
jgi:hypothetical protein